MRDWALRGSGSGGFIGRFETHTLNVELPQGTLYADGKHQGWWGPRISNFLEGIARNKPFGRT